MPQGGWAGYLSDLRPSEFYWGPKSEIAPEILGALSHDPHWVYSGRYETDLLEDFLSKADNYRAWLHQPDVQDPAIFRHRLDGLVPEVAKVRSLAVSLPAVDRCIISLIDLCIDRQSPLVVVYPVAAGWPRGPTLTEAAARCARQGKIALYVSSSRSRALDEFSLLETETGGMLERFPTVVLDADGSMRLYSPRPAQDRRPALFVARASTLDGWSDRTMIGRVGCVMSDVLPSTTGEECCRLLESAARVGSKACVFISRSSAFNGVLALQDRGLPVWEFSRAELAREEGVDLTRYAADPGVSSRRYWEGLPRIANALGQRGMTLTWVKDESTNEQLLKAYRSLEALARLSERGGPDTLARVCRSLGRAMAATESLIAPPSRVDSVLGLSHFARPLRDLLDGLRKSAERLRGEDPGASAMAVGAAEALSAAYERLDRGDTGKPSYLLAAVRKALEKQTRLTIVCRTRAQTTAVGLHLRERFGLSWEDADQLVNVVTMLHVRDAPLADACLVYGAPRSWEEDVVRSGCASRLGFLLYPTESNRIRWLLRREYGGGSDLHARKIAIVSSLTGVRPPIPPPPSVEPPVFMAERMEWEEPDEPRRMDWVASVLSSYETGTDSDEGEEGDTGDTVGNLEGETQFVEIILRGGRRLQVGASRRVPVYYPERRTVEDVAARSLAPNSLLLLIDGGVRKTLDQMVIERVDHLPQMFATVVLRGLWHEALVSGAAKERDTPATALTKLRAAGSNIQEPVTVQLWMEDEVIGPLDEEDLARIAKVYQHAALQKQLREVWAAVCKLRAVHRNLCRLLWRLLPAAYLQATQEEMNADEVIDKRLGLTLDDFRDSISIEKVESVSAPFDRGTKGARQTGAG